MMILTMYGIFILCALFTTLNCDYTYYTRKTLIGRLLTNYSKHIRPKLDQKELVVVQLQPLIEQIVNFDGSSGVFSWYGSFEMKWTDDHLTWNVSEYDNTTQIHVPLSEVWVPKPIVANSVSKRTIYQFDNRFDYQRAKVLYHHNGSAYLLASGIIDTSCDADIVYFPADDHICQLELYPEYEDMKFAKPDSDLYKNALEYFQGDSEWDVRAVTSNVYVHEGQFKVVFSIKIQRKPLHLIFSLILPLILVSVLNIFTFVLPVDSGEGTSFAVTLFITFAVVMTAIADSFPATDKISAFTIFLILRLIMSTLTTIVAIISISIYFRQHEEKINESNDKKQRDLTTTGPVIVDHTCVALPQDHKKSSKRTYGKDISFIIDHIALVFLVSEIGIEFVAYAIFFAIRS